MAQKPGVSRELTKLEGTSRAKQPSNAGCSIGCTLILGSLAWGSWMVATGGLGIQELQELAPPRAYLMATWVLAFMTVSTPYYLVKESVQKHRRKTRALQHPDQPWWADYDWSPDGIADDTGRDASGALWGAFFVGWFMAPVNYVLFFTGKHAPLPIKGGVILADLLAVGWLLYGLYLTARMLRFGRGRLKFNSFPFFLGQKLSVSYRTGRDVGRFDRLEIVLRCVEERAARESSVTERFQVYSTAVVLDQAAELPTASSELPLDFSLPEDLPPTCLSGRPPSYWELEITAVRPGLDMASVFVLPVYRL